MLNKIICLSVCLTSALLRIVVARHALDLHCRLRRCWCRGLHWNRIGPWSCSIVDSPTRKSGSSPLRVWKRYGEKVHFPRFSAQNK